MIGITNVHEAFSDWLALPDPQRGGAFDTVDLALATVIANRLVGQDGNAHVAR